MLNSGGFQNALSMISAMIPEELKDEIEELMKEEGLEEGIALKKLLTMAISEWKEERALKMQIENYPDFKQGQSEE